jgi:large subunit ribosomal protein L29
MKIDAMVEWSAEERAVKEKEWRQALFTLTLQKASGQLDNPMRLREIRKDIARLKTLDHMDAARAAAQKVHAEHEAAAHAASAPSSAAETPTTEVAAPAMVEQAGRSEEAVSPRGKKAPATPKRTGKGGARGKAASARTPGKKTAAPAKGHSPSRKKSALPPGKAGSPAKSASKTKSK